MATIVASTSSTIVNLLKTVDVSAMAVTQAVTVVASGVDMLAKFVSNAQEAQDERLTLEKEDRLYNLKLDAGVARMDREKEIAAKYSDSELAVLNQHIAKYDALFVTVK